MPSQIKTRGTRISGSNDQFGGGIAGSFLLHASAAALLLGWAWFSHSGQNWGNSSATAGAIQATMVNALPLPPRQPTNQDNVLATETPSPAPITPKPKTVEAPRPEAIPVPARTPKPAKVADKTTVTPPQHTQPVKVDPNKAQTGEASGVRIAMSSMQTTVGTFNINVSDASFGTRFAYYIAQINRKVQSQYYVGMLDSHAAGHRLYISFQVQRDGTPTNIRIAQASGDQTLDQVGLNAMRHVDTFGPLPDAYSGSYVNVTYYFDPPPHP